MQTLIRVCIFFLTSVTISAFSAEEIDTNANQVCASSQRLSDIPPALEKPIILPANEFEIGQVQRPCLKSYPWPEHKFLSAQQKSQDNEEKSAVTANEMLKIMNTNNVIAENFKATSSNDIFAAANDMHEMIALYRLKEGMLPEQINLFGAFLYLYTLTRENRYQEALDFSKKIISDKKITAAPTIYDDLEQATYFSKQSLSNLIIILQYTAISYLAEGTLKDQQENLADYSKIRKNLVNQFKIVPDPYEYLYENAGCNLE